MQIIIEYESSWRNSFLSGSNNERLTKDGRQFIASIKKLKDNDNFKRRSVTKDTIMGILNRLIGDQRKLYQSRECSNYYFKKIESLLKEEHWKDEIITSSQEIVFLRNISGNTSKNSFAGVIKSNDISFKSEFSKKLWGVLFLSEDQIVNFIIDDRYVINENIVDKLDPLLVSNRLTQLGKSGKVNLSGNNKVAYNIIANLFTDKRTKFEEEGSANLIIFYTSALYVQVSRLKKEYDLSGILTKGNNLDGISKKGFTKKDFMRRYATVSKKLVVGNPYIFEKNKEREMLTKVNGRLIINIYIRDEEAHDLKEKIESAGVSAFYMGKKGLAYVSEIIIK